MPESTSSRIIIVDDADAMRSVLRGILSANEYDVVAEHPSGRGLLDSVERHRPHIVCLDYNLPGEDGLKLLKAIHAEHPTVSVVMITGNDSVNLESAAAEAGASGFIHKPFTQQEILREIRHAEHAQRLLVSAPKAKARPEGEAPRARAVIADDSATMRKLLAAILAHANIEVVGEACDGRQAVEQVAEHQPDFVCLDIEMPHVDGFKALKEMRAANPEVKALMITAKTEREAVIQAAQAGAKGYLGKPFQPVQVIAAVKKLLG